jgi:hypothetical protein
MWPVASTNRANCAFVTVCRSIQKALTNTSRGGFSLLAATASSIALPIRNSPAGTRTCGMPSIAPTRYLSPAGKWSRQRLKCSGHTSGRAVAAAGGVGDV